MQPQPLVERHLILKPTKSPTTTVQVGARQGIQSSQKTPAHGDLFYVQLVGVVDASQDASVTTAVKSSGENGHVDLFPNSGQDGGARIIRDTKHETSDTAMVSTEDTANVSQQGLAPKAQSWSFEFRDLPEVPGRRPVTSRLMNSTPILAGDPIAFVEAFGPYV